MAATEPLSKDESTVIRSVATTGLKRRSVIVMIVLTFVTLGLYYPIWFLRRRGALNRLDSPRKLRLWPFVIFIALFVLQFIVRLVSAPGRPERIIGEGPALLLSLARLAVGILMVVQCFFIKNILEDHLLGPEGTNSSSILVHSVKLSGLMTFFFTTFYLQYVINRDVVSSQQPAV